MTYGPGTPGDGQGWPQEDQDAPGPGRTQVPPAVTTAMPTRVGTRSEAAPSRRRRGRKTLVVVIVALLVAGAGAVVLALPDVANRLALPWAPNAPLSPEPVPVAVERSIQGLHDDGEGPTKEGVADALRGPMGSSALGSVSGSVIDTESGRVLWDSEAERPLPPASTTKLLTAAAALLSLEPTSTLTTSVVAGDEPGSVVLLAGGDTTLSSLGEGKDGVYPGAGSLDDLVAQVRKASDGKVTTVHVDTSAFSGDSRAAGWSPEDAPSTYAAPIVPIMLDGGRTDPTDKDSQRVGEPAKAVAQELAKRLGAGVGQIGVRAGQDAAVLGEVHSAPLTELVETMLVDSDNILAEALARRVALSKGREPSFSGAAEATEEILAEAGFDVSGVELSDASGLSEKNRVPARLLTDVLASAAGESTDTTTARLRPMLAGLPVAGGSGTLADRYGKPPASDGKGWVRAKTGTLSEVNTLAGVVLDTDGEVLVFALMSSGTGPNEARPALDAVAAALRNCGCR